VAHNTCWDQPVVITDERDFTGPAALRAFIDTDPTVAAVIVSVDVALYADVFPSDGRERFAALDYRWSERHQNVDPEPTMFVSKPVLVQITVPEVRVAGCYIPESF